MTAALIAEYRKLVSTRMWWLLLIVMAAYLAFLAAMMGLTTALAQSGDIEGAVPIPGAEGARSVYALTNPMGYAFALVIGSLAVTAEFRHQTITGTLLVEPRRSVTVLAKVLACVPVGLFYGLVATLVVVVVGAPVLAFLGDGAFLGEGETIKLLLMSVVVLALWTVMGVCFGTLVSNQVAAIVTLLAFTQFVEPVARLALAAFDATQGVAAYLPGAAADAVLGTSFFGTTGLGVDLLPRWAGVLLMLAYCAVFALLGRLTTFRRDIG
ncbi:MAG: ABC transporter permease [Aeromicrobium sp.]|uniref:ABC transporter permease n=1 Tax=Aeromicrobium sp. TaxID=1871063 RepID=UPI0039E2AD05